MHCIYIRPVLTKSTVVVILVKTSFNGVERAGLEEF